MLTPERVFRRLGLFDSVSARMMAVIMSAIAPISALGVALVWVEYSNISQSEVARGNAVAAQVNERLRHDVDRTVSALEMISGFGSDHAQISRFLTLLHSASGQRFCSVAELDANGAVIEQMDAQPQPACAGLPPEGLPGGARDLTDGVRVLTGHGLGYLRMTTRWSGGFMTAVMPIEQVGSVMGGNTAILDNVTRDQIWAVGHSGAVMPFCSSCDWTQPDPDIVARLRVLAQRHAAAHAGDRSALRVGASSYVFVNNPDTMSVLVVTRRSPADGSALRALELMVVIVTGMVITGMLGIIIAARWLVMLPLSRLGDAVKAWQSGGNVFDTSVLRDTPLEFRRLGVAFAIATRRLARRESQLTRSVARQDLLIREIHHRVKNNLQIVASLLNLQGNRIRSEDVRKEFMLARDRVRALATLHRHLYGEGKLEMLNVESFLSELGGQLLQAAGQDQHGRIELRLEIDDFEMVPDQAVPLALIVTEAVTNAVKYAFPGGRRGLITIEMRLHGEDARLVISDDGVGMPETVIDSEEQTGIGITLIRGFAKQIGAVLEMGNDVGMQYVLTFRIKRYDV